MAPGYLANHFYLMLLVLHLLLHLVDALQGLQALVQQEGGVVDQHVDVAHKLLPGAAGGGRRRGC